MPQSPPPRRPHAERALTVAVVLAFVVLVALRFDEAPVGAMTDDAVYAEMARSLAEGRGPVLHVGPDAPAANPGIFPPGFPLLLAPLALAFPASLAALKAVPLLAALLLVPLCRRLPVPGAGAEAGVARPALLALVLLNPWVVGWAGRVLSDLPYASLSLAALLAFEPWRRTPRPSPGPTLLLALLTGMALLVRSIGLALLLAMLAVLASGRQWRHLLALALPVAATQAVLLLPGWSGGAVMTAAYRTQLLGHSDGPGARLAFMAGNAWGYLRELPVALWPGFGAPLRRWCEAQGAGGLYAVAQPAAGALLLGLVAIGWRALHRDPAQHPRARLWLAYLAFYAVALVNFAGWPTGVQPRLLLPALPLLYALLLGGALVLAGRGGASARRRTLTTVCAALLVGSLGHNAWRVARPLGGAGGAAGAEAWADPGAGAAWLRAHGGPVAVVMAPDPLPRHLHLRLPVIDCGDTLTATALRRRAAAHGAGWLVVGPPGGGLPGAGDRAQAVAAAAAQAPQWFEPAWSAGRGLTAVYRLVAAAPEPVDQTTR
jgi:hypothetical protein